MCENDKVYVVVHYKKEYYVKRDPISGVREQQYKWVIERLEGAFSTKEGARIYLEEQYGPGGRTLSASDEYHWGERGSLTEPDFSDTFYSPSGEFIWRVEQQTLDSRLVHIR